MSDWKNKLESLEGLSSQPLDKGKSWEKLYARLEKKPGKKYRLLYWVAAACLLSGFFLIRSISDDKSPDVPENISKTTPAIITPEKIITPISTELTVEKKPFTATKKPVFNVVKRSVPTPVLIDPEEFRVSTTQDSSTNATAATAAIPEVDKENNIADVKPKKSLRVVHINELGKPVKEEIIMAQRELSGNVIFKIGNSNYTISPTIINAGHNNSRIVFNPTN